MTTLEMILIAVVFIEAMAIKTIWRGYKEQLDDTCSLIQRIKIMNLRLDEQLKENKEGPLQTGL